MTIKNKNVLMNIRVRDDIRKEFKIACELKGAKASHLIHQFMVKIIREEKERDPAAFEEQPTPVNENLKPDLLEKVS